jgi:Antitoxin ParD
VTEKPYLFDPALPASLYFLKGTEMKTRLTIGTAAEAFLEAGGVRGGRKRQETSAGEDQAWRELKTLIAQRVADGLSGTVSAKSFDAIVGEELRQA